jgi:hypothetical protein
MAENTDVRLLRLLSINTYEQERALLAVGTAPALAKDTTSIKPTGKAKKAAAARPEALISRA